MEEMQMNNAINDPWIVQAPKPKAADVPVGNYVAAFRKWEDVSLPEGKFKPGESPLRWRWVFAVQNGPHAGTEISALTTQQIRQTTLAGRIIAGLLKAPLKVGDNVKDLLGQSVGQSYLVRFGPGPKGGAVQVQDVGSMPVL